MLAWGRKAIVQGNMIIIYDKSMMTGKELIKHIRDDNPEASLSIQEADTIPQCLLLNDLGTIPVIAEDYDCRVEKRITDMGVIATMALIDRNPCPKGNQKDMSIMAFREGSPHICFLDDIRLDTGMLILDSLIRRERHSPFGTFEKLLWSMDFRPTKPGYAEALTSCACLVQSYEDKRFYLSFDSNAERFGKTESEISSTLCSVEKSLSEWYRNSPYWDSEKDRKLDLSGEAPSVDRLYDPISLTSADSIMQLIINLKYINVCRNVGREK